MAQRQFKAGDWVKVTTSLPKLYETGYVGVITRVKVDMALVDCSAHQARRVGCTGRVWVELDRLSLVGKPPHAITDTDRLRFLAGYGTHYPIIEGFVNVDQDIYELQCEVMGDDAGSREATDDEKLEAFRRLVDMAMEVTS